MRFKIFPATINNEGQKLPLIKNWYELASNDPAQIKLWQELFRDRIKMWGMPCGEVNGIFVLDIDVKKANGWESLKKLNYVIPPTLSQNTPSGGSHFLFATEPGKHYPNSVNQELGLDTRGTRGWIAFYGFTNDLPLAPAPSWMFELSPKPKSIEANQSLVTLAPEIAEKIWHECLENIREAPPGEGNDVLNTQAFKVGQLIASNGIDKEFAKAELFKAAKERGRPDYEAKATIESGINGGLLKPLTSPFTAEPPKALFEIPPVPGPPERWTPTYLSRSDLLNTSKLRKPQLFQDWSTEDICITTADGGTGKTTMKLYEAVCLALGERFLGFDCKQTGKTLFITGEDTQQKLGAMLGAIMQQMGLFNGTPENEQKIQTILDSIVIKKDGDLCLVTKDKLGFFNMNVDAFNKVMQAIDDIKPKMIVFDPIAMFWGPESGLNDMNKAVIKFMSLLVEKSGACVDMINHMGKSSSSSKDMSQFAGRGGSGLPSNSRVSRVLRGIPAEEFMELMGVSLPENQSAMLCNVNKFTDGSPLTNNPFLIIRNGYLFSGQMLSPQKAKEIEKTKDDQEAIFNFIKEERTKGRWPTEKVVVAHFMSMSEPVSEAKVKRAITALNYHGRFGEKVEFIDNPNAMVGGKALTIIDQNGKEV